MDAAVVLLDGFLAHGAFLSNKLVDPLVVLVHDHVVPVPQVSALQRPVPSQATMPAHFRLAFTNHSRIDDSVQVDGLSTCLVGADLHMDAFLRILQAK